MKLMQLMVVLMCVSSTAVLQPVVLNGDLQQKHPQDVKILHTAVAPEPGCHGGFLEIVLS